MQAYIYKPKSKEHGTGGIWHAHIKRDGDSKARRFSLRTSDEQTAKDKLAALVHDMEQEGRGNTAPRLMREAAIVPLLEHMRDSGHRSQPDLTARLI